MPAISRRLFLTSSAAAAGMSVTTLATAQQADTGAAAMSLEDALKRRESIRLYAPETLPDDLLLRILWAANGINRPEVGGRTAPSARTAYDIETYVATADGVRLYDPDTAALTGVLDADVRQAGTDAQRFVRSAPAVLIYVSDRQKLIAAGYNADNAADLTMTGRVNAAIIAQNVYLFAAAEGLGTCLVGGINRADLETALGLGADRSVAFIQPIGYPG